MTQSTQPKLFLFDYTETLVRTLAIQAPNQETARAYFFHLAENYQITLDTIHDFKDCELHSLGQTDDLDSEFQYKYIVPSDFEG